jgi:hypothetical protein
MRLHETLESVGFDPSDAAAIAGKFYKEIGHAVGAVGPTATVGDVFTETDLNQRLCKIVARYLARLPRRKREEIECAFLQTIPSLH